MFRTLLVIMVVAAASGYYYYTRYAENQAREALSEALERRRATFAEQAAAIVGEPTEDYARQIKDALRSYDGDLDALYAEHPEWLEDDAFERHVEEAFAKGEIKATQKTSMLEGYAMVKEAYEVLRSGDWEPVLSRVTENGNVRVDIYDIRRIREGTASPMLEAKMFLWGIEDETRVSWGRLEMQYWTMGEPTRLQKKQMRRTGQMKDEVEIVLGRAEGSASPYVIIQAPQKYVSAFPSYVAVATLRIPVMPSQAHAVDVNYDFTANDRGRSIQASFAWRKVPVRADWQLRTGEAWDADVVEATEEEIAGKRRD
ncbi:MAG: hypothetical protein ACFB9M_08880 [Myxococcota bacterium]